MKLKWYIVLCLSGFLTVLAATLSLGDGPCPLGQRICNGTCVDTIVDANNCGGCGIICNLGEECRAGNCIAGQSCDDGNPCTIDTHVNNRCMHTPDCHRCGC